MGHHWSGTIGRRVADLAKAFGCHVIYYSTSGNHTEDGYERVDFDTLLKTSDIVSVHAPLTEQTETADECSCIFKNEKTVRFLSTWDADNRGGSGSGRCAGTG